MRSNNGGHAGPQGILIASLAVGGGGDTGTLGPGHGGAYQVAIHGGEEFRLGTGGKFGVDQAFREQALHRLQEFTIAGMLVHHGVGAIVQHAELAVAGCANAEGVQQAGHAALAIGALLQGQGNFVIGVAVAVQVIVLDGTPQFHPLVPIGGNVHFQGVQPVLTDHHGLGTGHIHDGGDGVDVAVRLAPVRHALLAHSCHDVGDQVQILVQGNHGALIDQVHHAVVTGIDDVRQRAGGQGGSHLGSIVVLHAPVNSDGGVGQGLDGGEIVASVKLSGVVVEVNAHAGDFQGRFKVKGLAGFKRLGGFDQRGVHLGHFRRDILRHGGGDAQQHCQSQDDCQNLFHVSASLFG